MSASHESSLPPLLRSARSLVRTQLPASTQRGLLRLYERAYWLPSRVFRRLRRGAGNILGKALRALPVETRLVVRERLGTIGRLDYRPASIPMVLGGIEQFQRLRACEKEPETVAWIERCMQPGQVMYDVGANVGAYSLVAHAVAAGDCRVYAFEPSCTTFAALCENIRLNNCANQVVPLNVVLGQETALRTFSYSSMDAGASLHNGEDADGQAQANSVGTSFVQQMPHFRLDDLVKTFGLARPHHVKIDVDGGELGILHGAETVFSDPTLISVLMEVEDRTEHTPAIMAFMQEHGFTVTGRFPRNPWAANYVFEREQQGTA